MVRKIDNGSGVTAKTVAVLRGMSSRLPARHNYLALLEQGVASSTRFLTGILIARAVSKESFGIYALTLTVVLFLMSMQASLILSHYTIYAPRLGGRERSLFNGSSLLQQLVMAGVAAALLYWAGAPLAEHLGPRGLGEVMAPLSVALLFMLLFEYVRRALFADQLFGAALLLSVSCAVLQLGSLWLLGRWRLLTVSAALAAMGASCGVVSAVYLAWNRRAFRFQPGKAVEGLRASWSLGKWVFAATLVDSGTSYLYAWMVADSWGLAETATFAVCQGVAGLANPFLMANANILRPKTAHAFAHGGKTALLLLVRRSMRWIACAMTGICAVLMIGGEWLSVQLYGSNFSGTGMIITILAVSTFALALAAPTDYGLWAMERTDLNFWLTLLCSLPALLIGCLLIQRLGLTGAALGVVIWNVAKFVSHYLWFSRTMQLQPTEMVH